jgi:hypothetical protein
MPHFRRPLFQLAPGTRFRQPDLDLTGTLISVHECRARVRLDQPQQLVEFAGPDGETRSFRATRMHETSWAATVVVEALSVEPLSERDLTMAKKSNKQAPAKKTTKKAAKSTNALDQVTAGSSMIGMMPCLEHA